MSLPRVVWYGNLVDLSGSDSDGELGRRGEEILGLVHHRSVGSLESLIREFTNASTSGKNRRVCSHFAIGFLGTELVIAQFIALENTAYCNGQLASDRAACRWQPWIDAGRPGTNYITVSTEHEDNGSSGNYVVVAAIVEASIELDRLLLSGDGPSIRRAGIRCSDTAARQLGALEPSTDTLIDHKVCAPVSKPFCWRPIGDDAGFPQARFIAALSEVPDMPGLRVHVTGDFTGRVKVNDAGASAVQLADREMKSLPLGYETAAYATAELAETFTTPGGTEFPAGTDGVLVGLEPAFVFGHNVDLLPTDQVQAELERAADRAHDAVLATG